MSKQQELPGAWTEQRILQVLCVRQARRSNELTRTIIARIEARIRATTEDTLNQ